jgi:arsenite/tail-anchored protein-transporting ATPase
VGTRVIVYTGKGGVGKTSVAAASAILCADREHRTLVVSTDIAHSLGDAFGERIGPEPTQLGSHLWGQETDVYSSIHLYWGDIQRYFAEVFQWHGLDAVVAEEMSVLPGLDELACLLRIIDHYDSGKFDVIVVDAAPTGETVRLLSLPEAARWWLERIMPIQRRAMQLAGPVLRRLTGMPMPGDAVFRAGEDLFRKLDRMHRLLSDPDFSSIRIVLNLERMVIAEARRSFTYFHLFGYPTDLVVCNRILPADSGDYFARLRDAQQAHLATLDEAFAPVPIKKAPYFGEEVIGQTALRALGRAIFEGADPAMFFHRGRPYRVDRDDAGYTLSLELPFASKSDVDLIRTDDELVVQVGPWRRNLVLPRVLASLAADDAELKDGVLRIRFATESAPEEVRTHV